MPPVATSKSAVIIENKNSLVTKLKSDTHIEKFFLLFLHSMKANKKSKVVPAFQRTNSQKRSLIKSPTESQLSPEQGNNLKARKMAEYADKNDIQELKYLITNNAAKMNDEFEKLNNNVLSITKEISSIKNDMKLMEARVKSIEKTRESNNETISKVSAELNAINQVNLETQLSILNIPPNIEVTQALNSISNWSSIELNDKNIRRAVIVKPATKNTSILQLDFYDLSTKHMLMNYIRINQKDKDKKYVPILTEKIFNISASDPARGIELNFRDSFTELNRNIFNTARKHKDIFVNVWLSRGFIMVKQGNGNKTRINSIEHLNILINNLKDPNTMQS